MSDFKFSIIQEYAPFFLSGTWLTIKLSLIAILCGFLLGLVLALLRTSKKKYLSFPALLFIESIRGTPLLLQLLITYFGIVPLFMKKPDGVLSAALALSINAGAYIAETIRAGILSVDVGQGEAASALGLSAWQSMRHVILPQAMRLMIRPLGVNINALIKATALVAPISVVELTYTAQRYIGSTYRPFEMFLLAGILYLIIILSVGRLVQWLDRKARIA